MLPLAGVLLIFFLKSDNGLADRFGNTITGLSFFGIFFSLLVMLNALVGLFVKPAKGPNPHLEGMEQGLIFAPNTVARYKTAEFDYNAEINSLGLRNKEVKVDKEQGTFRILCFGDSWTFGWGVDVTESWPMQLEEFLHAKGYPKVEVINCGQGGQYTSTYKEYMARAVPLLKPDLVLVGVLQLDDLAQLFENNFEAENNLPTTPTLSSLSISKAGGSVTAFLEASFSNYLKLFYNDSGEEISVNESWKTTNKHLIEGFENTQRLRFSTLSDTVQALFKTGDLNPSLLNYYINFPDRETIFNNPHNPATRFALQEMDKDLKEMKTISRANEAEMVFINLPISYLTGHKVDRTPSDFLNKYFMDNNKIDSVYHQLAVSNDIPYMELTQRFRELENKEKYFFQFDGHPNEEGYKEIGFNIGQYLLNNNLIKN